MGGMYPAMRMILVSNHGADAYAYMTEDAGKTWKPYEIDTFKKCNYVNGISIEKKCRQYLESFTANRYRRWSGFRDLYIG